MQHLTASITAYYWTLRDKINSILKRSKFAENQKKRTENIRETGTSFQNDTKKTLIRLSKVNDTQVISK